MDSDVWSRCRTWIITTSIYIIRKHGKLLGRVVLVIWFLSTLYQTVVIHLYWNHQPPASLAVDKRSDGDRFALDLDVDMQAKIQAMVDERVREELENQQGLTAEEVSMVINTEHGESQRIFKEQKHQARQEIEEQVSGLREKRTYYVLRSPSSKHSTRKRKQSQPTMETRKVGVIEASLQELGYREASGVTDAHLLWVVASQFECGDPYLASEMNSVSDASKLIVFCAGDLNSIEHIGRKDVLDQRLRWFDVKLHAYRDCPLYSDFIPPTLVVNPHTDPSLVERSLRDMGLGVHSRYIIKQQDSHDTPTAETMPIVTRKVLSDLKHLQRRSRKGTTSEGLIVQKYIANPLLWSGRKFSLRAWTFMVSSSPLVVYYHDGVIYRSLESYYHPTSSSSHHKNRFARYANITTQQRFHPQFGDRLNEAFGCQDDWQEYISETERNEEMKHYVELILKPYLKRLIIFAIKALRREHISQEMTMPTMQHLCFDFILDENWNVYMVDVDNRCAIQAGGSAYISACKRSLLDALGATALKLAEEFYITRSKNSRKHVEMGTFEPLIDESEEWSIEKELCKRSVYQDFRKRQTFSRRVVQSMLPLVDGVPKPKTDQDMDFDRPELAGSWACPVCGYDNHAKARFCDMCGVADQELLHPLKEQEDHSHFDHLVMPSSSSHEIVDAIDEVVATTLSEGTCSGHAFVIHNDADLINHDIEPLRTASSETCCKACATNSHCNAFTFDHGNFQCWLKSEKGIEGHKAGLVSGYRQHVVSDTRINSKTIHLGSSAAAQREYYRKELSQVFAQYDPKKLSRVDTLLDRYRGNEERYIRRVIQQYETMAEHNKQQALRRDNGNGEENSVEASKEFPDKYGMTLEEYRERLKSLFIRYEPSKLPTLETLLSRFKGREMELLQHLMQEYHAKS